MGLSAAEVEAYIRDAIRKWVWSGYHDADDVAEMLEDILEEGVDVDAMHVAISEQFRLKAAAEANWPSRTDCDKVDEAFIQLDQNGVCAVQYAGYTMSDGYSDVAEALAQRGRDRYHGYCFFHGQDVERAIDGHGLMVAFGDLDDDPARTVVVGHEVCDALRKAGFDVEWNGDGAERISIPKIDWKRRF